LLCEEPICLVSGIAIDSNELLDYPLITHPYSGVNDIVQRWWQQNFSLAPRIAMEVDNVDIGLQMILRNLGWGILPAIGLENYPSLYKKNLYWQDGTPITRKTWLMCRHSLAELSTVKAFTDFLISAMSVLPTIKR
jgi:DNA-binding transcriptional LysR family regulator